MAESTEEEMGENQIVVDGEQTTELAHTEALLEEEPVSTNDVSVDAAVDSETDVAVSAEDEEAEDAEADVAVSAEAEEQLAHGAQGAGWKESQHLAPSWARLARPAGSPG